MLSERTLRRELKLVTQLIGRLGCALSSDPDYKNIKTAQHMLLGCRLLLQRILNRAGDYTLAELIMNYFWYPDKDHDEMMNMRYRLGLSDRRRAERNEVVK